MSASDRGLSASDPAALERMHPRQRQIVEAMVALDVGERAGVLAAARAARAAGQADIAWLLELLATDDAPLPNKSQRPTPRALPGAGEVPDILHAVQAWRAGGKPRGTALLRRLAAARPTLAGLLDIVGHKRRASWDGLARMSTRERAVLVAAYASVHATGPDLAVEVRRVVPDGPLDLSGYQDAPDPLADAPELRRWVADPQVAWTTAASFALAPLALRRDERSGPALRELLSAVHRRLVAGQGRGLLVAIRACRELARVVAPAMVGSLEVLERRLGGLLEPVDHLPTLLTLWRRSAAWPRRERLVIAKRVMEVVAEQLAADADPPEAAILVSEVLAFLVVHAEPPEVRVALLEAFGWLLPEARFRELLAPIEPATRSYLLASYGFADRTLEAPLAAVIELASRADADGLTGKLLMKLLDALMEEPQPPRVLRQLERTLAALAAKPRLRLTGELLPALLVTTRELRAGVEPARALVGRALERPVADGDPEVAEHILARHLLGDDAGVTELVRRVGRWLRHVGPDAADDLALAVLARVYDRLDAVDDGEALRRLVAPLGGFVLREGPERPLQAATRAGATSSTWARGFGAWAREHIERLGPAPLWQVLIAMTEELEADCDELDACDHGREIPY